MLPHPRKPNWSMKSAFTKLRTKQELLYLRNRVCWFFCKMRKETMIFQPFSIWKTQGIRSVDTKAYDNHLAK